MREVEIMNKLMKHKELVCEKYGETNVLGVFLYGSQNYGLNTETSDVDTKAIIVPRFEDLVKCKSVSVELTLPELDNAHCEVKDIREMVFNYKKTNINFIETMFTEYFWVNPRYEEFWNKYIIKNRELLTRYNENYTVLSLCGQFQHTLKQLRNNPSQKKAANCIFLENFLVEYLGKSPYITCIYPRRILRDYLKDVKTGNIKIPYAYLNKLEKEMLNFKLFAECSVYENNQKKCDKIYDAFIMEVIKYNCGSDFNVLIW